MSKRTATLPMILKARNNIATLVAPFWLWLGILVLLCAVFLTYLPSMNGGFILDDNYKVVQNLDIRDWSNIWSKLIYPYKPGAGFTRNDPSRPVVYLTYAWNYHLGGLNPIGYHLFNVFLHLINAILLWLLLTVAWRKVLKEASPWFPFVAALIFAVHPMLVSTVAYTFSRSDILATLFVFAAMLLFLRASDKSEFRWLAIAGTLVCFGLSLLSKQSSAILPVAVLLFDLIVNSKGDWKVVWQRKYYHLGLWLCLAGYLGWRLAYFKQIGDLEAVTKYPLVPYLLSQPYSFIRYLQFLVLPVGLCVDHRIPKVESFFEMRSLISWVLILSLIAILIVIVRRQTPAAKLILFMAAWFVLCLLPTSSIFPTTALLVENRVYLAGLGWSGIFALGYYLWARRTASAAPVLAMRIILGIHLAVLLVWSISRNMEFGIPRILWENAHTLYPDNTRALINLAFIYQNEGEDNKALQAYQQVLSVEPNLPELHAFRAIIYRKHGENDKAIEELDQEIKNNPNDDRPHINLGNLYQSLQRYRQAFVEYQVALQLNPQNAFTYYELGMLYIETQQFDDAIGAFHKSLQIQPQQAEVYNNLGAVYYETGRYQDAMREFANALQVDPRFKRAYVNLQRAEAALSKTVPAK